MSTARSVNVDKLEELRATAEGGTAGRNAYREGRQRLISDQRAAIDAALSTPVRMGSGTADALQGIIAPVGDAAVGRMGVAEARHGGSMDSLDAALQRALGQHGAARSLQYDTVLGDMQTATDRSLTLAEISRRQAEEAAARAGGGAGSYSQSEQKAAAEALGGLTHGQALTDLAAAQDPAFKQELARVSGRAFSHIRDPKERQALLQQVLDAGEAGDYDGIMAIVNQYAPQNRGLVDSVAGALRSTAGAIGLAPDVERDRNMEIIDGLLNRAARTRAEQEQAYRQLETDRYLYNQDAYTSLFGDPLLAAGLFPQSFEPVEEAQDTVSMVNQYVSSGMYGDEYEQAVQSEEEAIRFDIASGASLSYNIVDRVADRLSVEPQEIYEALADPTVASITKRALDDAAAAHDAGEKKPSEIKSAVTTYVRQELSTTGYGDYGKELAAIVREQYEALYGG